jgi:hypothetical protein
MSSRARPCDDALTEGRLRKAEQFWEAAEITREFANDEAEVGHAFVTLCVHAGVAASDVICCIALGGHASGEDHTEALALIAKVRPGGTELAKALAVLLGMKTRAGYSARPVSGVDRKRAQRQAERLVRAAQTRRVRR